MVSIASLIAVSTYFALPGAARSARAQDPPAHASHGWEEAWRIELSRGIAATPVWADSLLLVASLDRNLHAVAPGLEPRVVWKENLRGGLGSAPVVLEDRLLVGELGAEGRLVSLARGTGAMEWSIRLGDLVARPVATAERIYAVTAAGLVVAVSRTGVELWRTELETRVVARPAPLGDALLIAASNGTLFALDPVSGAVRERVDPDAGSIWGDAVMLDREEGPLAMLATLKGQLLAVTEELEIVARRTLPSRFFAGPILVDDVLYLAGHEGTVWAYEWPAAEIRWRRELPGALRGAPAVAARGLAVGDLGGSLYLLDRETGDLLWHARLDGAITAAPLATGSDLYLGTEQGTLYAFRPTS